MLKHLLKIVLVSFALITTNVTSANDDYTYKVPTEIHKTELECLAKNIYFESRGEPVAGQLAVAWVTLNRTRHADFPNTICKVVHQPYQFSWVKKGMKITDWKSYMKAVELAKSTLIAYNNEMVPSSIKHIVNALYFDSMAPKSAKKYARIGSHNFYVKI